MFHNIDEIYPKYGLYAYGEGRITKKARNMHFDGIPVIFIPGNAGSHCQGRLVIESCCILSYVLFWTLNMRILPNMTFLPNKL